MNLEIYVAAADGVWRLSDRTRSLEGHAVTALAHRDGEIWAISGDDIWSVRGTDEVLHTAVAEPTSILLSSRGPVIVGTERAHLYLLEDGTAAQLASFEHIHDRASWYTPWGGPPAVRSMAEAHDGTLLVNVHVGGIPRSTDGGATWEPTIDIDTDVHQVIAYEDHTLAATGVGFAFSRDGGATWTIDNDGLDVTYCRAVAVAGDSLLASASSSHTGRNAAMYRRPLDLSSPFERIGKGLPDRFTDNVDTYCVAAKGATAVLGAPDGSVYLSRDGGNTWERVAERIPKIRAVVIGE